MADLETTLAKTRWPAPAARASRSWESAVNLQHTSPIVDPSLVERLIPDERLLLLHPPPFRTVAEYQTYEGDFWTEHGALAEIDSAEALVVAEFELGSDSVVILDYRFDPAPALQLKYPERWGEPNHWVQIAGSIDQLVELLDLRLGTSSGD
ncbi:hypothetical protein [Nocardioides taihuensis]|uniref:SMI1/KNR4 family protein n=1 Tax=Nocardioides taihuensis TaxID=1835606 RepID=A0ABW0BFU5_9ACTN